MKKSKRTAIITGITGQDGAYLSDLLLNKNYHVIGIVRSSNRSNLNNLNYLGIEKKIELIECDLTDITSIMSLIRKNKPDEIYNLAAQSSVGLSFEQPIGTILFSAISVLNLLESIRITDKGIRFYQASSSEMFGKVAQLPVKENTPMHPLSPYAISKATAFWAVVNYRESYGLFACNGILFNHESYLRTDNYFVKKVIGNSIEIANGKRDTLTVGQIDLKRDFGYAPEYVKAMWLMLQHSTPNDYSVCSGNSVSLREIIYYIFKKLKIPHNKLKIDEALFRPVDIENIYGDNSKAKKILGWNYDMNFFQVLDILIEEEMRVK
jgi:GDPmannose 4,6-dehydratase